MGYWRALFFSLIALVACSRTELDSPLASATADALRPIAPLSTSTVTTRRPTFHWTGGDARVEVCSTRACDTIEATATGTLSAKLDVDLSPGVHFFRLKSLDGKETTPVWEFRVPHRSAPRDTSWGVFPDFDGDGFADLLVRSSIAFSVEVYPGSKSSIDQDRHTEVKIPEPNIINDFAAVGDVNGDGFGDLAVSRGGLAPSTKGVVYIFLGGPSGVSPDSPSITITPPSDAGDTDFGEQVSSAGDLNGDGYADILVTSENDGGSDMGRVYVYFGGPGGPSNSPAITLRPEGNRLFAVSILAEAGDVDGDGFADVVVGAVAYQTNPHDPAVFLYRGSASGPSDATRTTLFTPASDMCLALSRTPADFDGDGLADVAIGIISCEGPFGPGQIAVVRGGAMSEPTMLVPPPGAGSLGLSLQSGGDIDGNGFDDLVVSLDLGDIDTSAVAFWGSDQGLAQGDQTVFDLSVDPDVRNAFSLTVSDLDGDGLDDVTLGRIDASPITVFSLTNGSLAPKATITPPGAQQFYEPILR